MIHASKYANISWQKQLFLRILHGKVWFPSLYQEVPCKDQEIQHVDLDPAYPWRFSSPRYPSTRGYPHRSDCQWEFTIDSKQVESVSVICDHVNIVGNFFGNCEDGDYLSIRHQYDYDEIDAPGRLCGDLSSWIPMNSTITIDQSEAKQRLNHYFQGRRSAVKTTSATSEASRLFD